MGHYENIVKIEEMRKKMNEKDVLSAQKILDTMDIRKIKNMSDLNLIAEVYTENERYDEAAELYLKIYEKTNSRKSLFRLVDLSIKRDKAEDAQYYLTQYQKIAPKDFYKYIFRYQIDRMKGEPYEVLIETLETLKSIEYLEQWAYELAKTYYKAGMEKECIRECSDIILWFGEGTYVEKAKMLRAYYSGDSSVLDELRRRTMTNAGKKSQDEKAGTDVRAEKTAHETPVMDAGPDNNVIQFQAKAPGIPEEETGIEASAAEGYQEDDFALSLKNDVESMLSEDWEPDYDEETDDYDSGDCDEGPGFTELENHEEDEDHSEQEFEDTSYQLLKEEELDDEDKRLNRMAEEYQFDPEEIFGNFLHVDYIKQQLVKSMEDILDDNTRIVRILITGDQGSGKTTLAKDFTLFLNMTGKLKSSKIAKIKADKLNSIDINAKEDMLRDCCLVVEEASTLKRKTIESLLDLSRKLQGDLAIIFEENKKNINQLFRDYPKLMDLFKNRVHLPDYSGDELLEFAYACFKQQDYQLNPKAETILKSKVDHIIKQSEQKEQQLNQIYNLTQAVMNSADIRMGRKWNKPASGINLNEAGKLLVLPEDFGVTA